jgi:hypothetical protein
MGELVVSVVATIILRTIAEAPFMEIMAMVIDRVR